MGAQGTKLIVLHDTADPTSRRDAEVFWDLAKRTGGCVLPFNAEPGKAARYSVGCCGLRCRWREAAARAAARTTRSGGAARTFGQAELNLRSAVSPACVDLLLA